MFGFKLQKIVLIQFRHEINLLVQKYSDSTLNFTGSNDVKNLTTSQSPPPSQFESFSVVGLGHSPQDACVSPVLHVTKIDENH